MSLSKRNIRESIRDLKEKGVQYVADSYRMWLDMITMLSGWEKDTELVKRVEEITGVIRDIKSMNREQAVAYFTEILDKR